MTLDQIYLKYNHEVFGKRLRIPPKNKPKFDEVEQMLRRSNIDLEEFALTIFTERAYISQQIGHLPINLFLSMKSLERFVNRLSTGTEVKKKSEYKSEEDWLGMELSFGNVCILCILQGVPYTDEQKEIEAGVIPGWVNHPKRREVIAEAQRVLALSKQCVPGTYDDIGQQLLDMKARREEYYSSTAYRDYCRKNNMGVEYKRNTGKGLWEE